MAEQQAQQSTEPETQKSESQIQKKESETLKKDRFGTLGSRDSKPQSRTSNKRKSLDETADYQQNNFDRTRKSTNSRGSKTLGATHQTRSSSSGNRIPKEGGDLGLTLEGETDFHNSVVFLHERSPGPKYEILQGIDKTHIHKPITRIGTDGRVKYFVKHTLSKGPGAYNPPEITGVHNPNKKVGGTFSGAHRDALEWAFHQV